MHFNGMARLHVSDIKKNSTRIHFQSFLCVIEGFGEINSFEKKKKYRKVFII